MMELIIGFVIGFIAGIFVYRNNVDTFGVPARKIDKIFDKLKQKKESS